MQLYELFHTQFAEAVFREQIRRVDLAGYLAEIDTSEAHCLLNPQRVRVQVSKFAKSLPVADAYGRAGVGPHAQACIYSKVAEQRLVP